MNVKTMLTYSTIILALQIIVSVDIAFAASPKATFPPGEFLDQAKQMVIGAIPAANREATESKAQKLALTRGTKSTEGLINDFYASLSRESKLSPEEKLAIIYVLESEAATSPIEPEEIVPQPPAPKPIPQQKPVPPAKPLPKPLHPAVEPIVPAKLKMLSQEEIEQRKQKIYANITEVEKEIANHHLKTIYSGGSLWLMPDNIGFRGEKTQKKNTFEGDWRVRDIYADANIFKILVKRYKIHLMPKDEDLVNMLFRVVDLIRSNETLKTAINDIKVKPIFDKFMIPGLEDVPKIVIYVDSGKDNAQKALNVIYDAFKDIQGLDRTPRQNEKVTSLIYFAQGNGEDKADNPREYFEGPDMVYFKSNVTGQNQDYHLINPAHRR